MADSRGAHQSNWGRSPIASLIETNGSGAVPRSARMGWMACPFGKWISSLRYCGKSCVGCGSSGSTSPRRASTRKKRMRVCGVP